MPNLRRPNLTGMTGDPSKSVYQESTKPVWYYIGIARAIYRHLHENIFNTRFVLLDTESSVAPAANARPALKAAQAGF